MLSFENITFKLNIRRKPNKIIRKKKEGKKNLDVDPIYILLIAVNLPPINKPHISSKQAQLSIAHYLQNQFFNSVNTYLITREELSIQSLWYTL